MRGKNLAFFLLVGTLTLGMRPLTAHAGLYPIIDEVKFHDFAKIQGSAYEESQTALKAGDVISLQVNVDSIYAPGPTVTVDLSGIGIASPITMSPVSGPGYHEVIHDRAYYSNYVYEFGPFTIGADVPDGPKSISIEAVDAAGNTVSSTTPITIDTASPAISISSLTFSTTSPSAGDYMYLSGKMSGTGSSLLCGHMTETLLDADGQKMQGWWPWSYTVEYGCRDLLAAVSADGTFTRVPFILAENQPEEMAKSSSFRLALQIFDSAGNTASTSIIVPVPKPAAPDPCIAANSCTSNVLFLPGIEGSRLYEGTGCGKGAEDMLWEPYEGLLGLVTGVGDKKVGDLALNTIGTSACPDIYTKEGEIIDAVNGSAIYASLISEMNGLKADGTINDWKPVAYDWRLSLEDLMTKGAQHGNTIYYGEATSTPYIEQTLRSLAESSKSGKVTIIAHSNGGLVAKALLQRLGSEASQSLVDKLIMVGVPQSGAPLDAGSLLVGYGAGIYKYGVPVVSNAAARDLAQNSPMAYHLLPSTDYFWSAGSDAAHPIIRFSGTGYGKEESAYGSIIKDQSAFDSFLLAKDGGRTKPEAKDLKNAEILNSSLIDYANAEHSSLDVWTPPSGIEVDQIAGWGVDTVAGMDFYTASSTLLNMFDSRRRYRPILTEDGDDTVPVPSALMIASSTNVKRYWIDMNSYNKTTSLKRSHRDLFEIDPLEEFIKDIIKSSTTTLPSNISATKPDSLTAEKKLTFFLHSPVSSFQIKDVHGRVGVVADSSPTFPGFTYGELGGVMYVTVPEDGQYEITIQGQDTGLLDLDMQERTGDVITASSTVENIPVTGSTLISLTISGGLDITSPIKVDENGDGQDVVNIIPVVGETVIYPEPEAAVNASDDSIPPAVVGGGAGGTPSSTPTLAKSITIPALSPVLELASTTATTTDASISTSTDAIASSTPIVVAVPARIRIAVQRAPKTVSAATPKQTPVNFSQTASVYEATHQPLFTKLAVALSDGFHRFWITIKKLF